MSGANNIQYHYIGQKPFLYKTGNTTKDGEMEYAWSRLSVQIDKLYPEGHLEKHGTNHCIIIYIILVIILTI